MQLGEGSIFPDLTFMAAPGRKAEPAGLARSCGLPTKGGQPSPSFSAPHFTKEFKNEVLKTLQLAPTYGAGRWQRQTLTETSSMLVCSVTVAVAFCLTSPLRFPPSGSCSPDLLFLWFSLGVG